MIIDSHHVTIRPPSQSSDKPGMDRREMAMLGASMWNCRINGDQACGMRESRESRTLANRGLDNYLMQSLFLYILQSDNYFALSLTYFVLCIPLLCSIYSALLCTSLYISLTTCASYLASTPITQLVTQSPSPSSPVLLVLQPCSNWHRADHPIISDRTPISSIMQEPMNSTTHWWSHSMYRSKNCPSSIVQDGGDTAINGTVPIYFRASPDLCHHVGRGINPCGGAVTVLSDCTCTVNFDLMPRQFTPKPVDSANILSIASTNSHSILGESSWKPFGLGPSVISTHFWSSDIADISHNSSD